jgi:hypothetical protein
MPRASRRRRRTRTRGLGQSVLVAIAATVTLVLVGGSLLAIHTQSQGYRSATTAGYVALADPLGQASARTGARLATLLSGAAALPATAAPATARGILQQGLDSAVQATATQATQARNLASPPPEDDLAARYTRVMDLRATATAAVRSTIDRLLGMQPLPVAGAPSTTAPAVPATQISSTQAAAELTAEGSTFEQSDALFRSVQASVATRHPAHALRASVWVPPPTSTAPLGSAQLGASAGALASSPALAAAHRLVATAVGITPPAVPTGGVGSVSTSCATPTSAVPGAAPAVVPPTRTLGASVTVTNCGNVPEFGVRVTVTVAPADAPGVAAPPVGARGGRSSAVTAMAAGSSTAPVLAPLPVANGHRYTVTVAVSLPPGQTDTTGSTQAFLVEVTA